jgi:hypothetical protein
VKTLPNRDEERRFERIRIANEDSNAKRGSIFKGYRSNQEPAVEEITDDSDQRVTDAAVADIDDNISNTPEVDEEKAKLFLSQQGWPISLQNALVERLRSIPMRYYIACDSNSMVTEDKRRLITKNDEK